MNFTIDIWGDKRGSTSAFHLQKTCLDPIHPVQGTDNKVIARDLYTIPVIQFSDSLSVSTYADVIQGILDVGHFNANRLPELLNKLNVVFFSA